MRLRHAVFLLIATMSSAAMVTAPQLYAQTALKGPKTSSDQYSGATYGPITSQDTLWNIASRYRQGREFSVYQVMQAIYELNPDAFEDNNINLLKNDAILKLPSRRYVQRVSEEKARQKAIADGESWQQSQPVKAATGETAAAVAPKPKPIDGVSKEDLHATKSALEEKLAALDEEQSRQFASIRQQFAESITNVKSILDENQKLYDRLDQVNAEIENLKNGLSEDGDLQKQMEQILTTQSQMLQMAQDEEARRRAEMEKSGFEWLMNPMTLIIGSVGITMAGLIGLVVWLMRRQRQKLEQTRAESAKEMDLAILEQPSEMDDLADALSDELSNDMGAQISDEELFGDDLADDVLADELKETLGDDFGDDVEDELLVPSEPEEPQAAALNQDDLDSLFDEEDEFDIEDEAAEEAIDLSELVEGDELEEADDSSLDELSSPQDDVAELMAEESILEEDDSLETELTPVLDDEPEMPEISIDDLLEANTPKEPELPASVNVEDTGSVNEEMLQQLDKEINSKNQELDSITDQLLNEIEQIEQMQSMLPDGEFLDEEEEVASADEPQHSIQPLDDLVDELIDDEFDTELEDLSGLESTAEQASDSNDAIDDIDALLAANSIAPEQSQEPDIAADDIDSLLEQEFSAPSDLSEADTAAENEPLAGDSDLTSELADDVSVDDIDQLLEQKASRADDALTDDAFEKELQELGFESALEDESQNEIIAVDGLDSVEDAVSESALESDAEELSDIDDLDAALAEFDETYTAPKSDNEDSLSEPVEDELTEEDDFDIALAEFELSDDIATQPDDVAATETDASEDEADEFDAALADFESADMAIHEEADLEPALEDELDNLREPANSEIQDDEDEFAALDESLNLNSQDSSAEDFEIYDEALAASDLEDSDIDLPEIGQGESEFDDAELEQALADFDAELDAMEAQADANAMQDELDDLPGLGDWLGESRQAAQASPVTEPEAAPEAKTEETVDTTDESRFAGLESLSEADFDAMLESLRDDTDVDSGKDDGLDLESLLDQEQGLSELDVDGKAEDLSQYLDVDTLLAESLEAEGAPLDEQAFDLDVSLEDFTGMKGDADVIDVDSDKGISTKLDLARAYLEMDDTESARELLEEVISEGSDEHQSEAKALLDRVVD